MVEINLLTMIEAPIERCFDLSRSIDLHLLAQGKRNEQAVGGVTSGLIGPGESVRWRATHFGVRQHLTSRITGYDRPFFLQDTMQEGAFRFMQHDHVFRELGPERTELKDRFVFAAPLAILGLIAEKLVLKHYMTEFLLHRNADLKRAAEGDQWRTLLGSGPKPRTACR